MNKNLWRKKIWSLPLWVFLLTACGESDSPISMTSVSAEDAAPTSALQTGTTTNTAYLQSTQLDTCRICHTPQGVAASTRFLLLNDRATDLDQLKKAWGLLGKNVQTNPLLTMPSQESLKHSGGQPWQENSVQYQQMLQTLQCFADSNSCASIKPSDPTPSTSSTASTLLTSRHGGHIWGDFCEGKTDQTPLPTDPRTLVKNGSQDGKAVYFNSFWVDCHSGSAAQDLAPSTCGEFRSRAAKGKTLLEGNGAIGAGTSFLGSYTEPLISVLNTAGAAMSASDYNNLWKTWGYKKRPEEYDQLVEQRYGFASGKVRNPYPLPNEDPNKTNGGSGQLPLALTQIRHQNGQWSGRISLTCAMCHAGKVDNNGNSDLTKTIGAIHGGGGLSDVNLWFSDLAKLNHLPTSIRFSQTRGTGNITNTQLFSLLTITDKNTLNLSEFMKLHLSASTGAQDIPPWWNVGSRPVKLYDGSLGGDGERSLLTQYIPIFKGVEASKQWVEQHDQNAAAYVLSVKAPSYPTTIDRPLAEQGAVLFHTKNLWNSPIQKSLPPRPPGGNGSCASCHGAYASPYVNDPKFLSNPSLAGIASYVVPQNIIETYPMRLAGYGAPVVAANRKNFFGYSERKEYCENKTLSKYGGPEADGYLAPPLHGVWASAPYFHNGSVPDVWGVLQSNTRPTFWRRMSRPPLNIDTEAIMGFDTDFSRAYDTSKLGWRYDVLQCGEEGVPVGVKCNANTPNKPAPSQTEQTWLNRNLALTYNFTTPSRTKAQIEADKIYNTLDFSQGNQGHRFVDVLTDAERRAIIEYLKTL